MLHIKKYKREKMSIKSLLLTSLVGVALTTSLANADTLTEFQKRIPGPKKLAMTQADYSGAVHNNAQYIADRQAIINHVTAYSYLIDEGRWDEWYALFSDDVIFETSTPCIGTLTARGKKAFKAFADLRYRGPGSQNNKTMRRHTMGNIHVAKQTDKTAEVRTYLFISSAAPDGTFKILTSGTYNATLEKRNGHWIITRWYIEVDAPLAPSPLPKGDILKQFTFTPDTRDFCKK
jgi:3-phenylpropionate/cinnamic acid dioxygenase small subunit